MSEFERQILLAGSQGYVVIFERGAEGFNWTCALIDGWAGRVKGTGRTPAAAFADAQQTATEALAERSVA